MKTSEKIVTGEMFLIAGLSLISLSKACFMLCDRVTKLERQQAMTEELLKKITTGKTNNK